MADCLQVVIALVITPDGFPLAYEVMDGNTSDRTTLRGFLDQIENTYGQAKRMWIMDRGIPSEAILAEMRNPLRPMSYLVGTGKGKTIVHTGIVGVAPIVHTRSAVRTVRTILSGLFPRGLTRGLINV
jgi:hypothetical protein